MNYQLKDLCSITKGATGIMKADGGKYPLVALSDERRSHSEFQFDDKAVIVPLISSTGHGHASMKRVHYQEGKFALGNILCAVIPKDEKVLNAKYLHLYLQQFKDKLLVPLMKGAANVSLPMNKLADVEIEVPSLKRQLEIIALEEEAAEYKTDLEKRLNAQDGDVAKLRQAILKEAMQGKLASQNAIDGKAIVLLSKIKTEKEKLIKEKKLKTEKELSIITVEEIPFSIPENWVWCKLGDICNTITKGSSPNWQGIQYVDSSKGILYITSKNVDSFKIDLTKATYVEERFNEIEPRSILKKGDLLTNIVGASIGRTALFDLDEVANINQAVCILRIEHSYINKQFLLYLMNSDFVIQLMFKMQFAPGRANLSMTNLANFPIPLPPLSEQNRIVNKIEILMIICDELQLSIQQSKIENEKLLQGALRDALKKEAVLFDETNR